MKRILLLFVVSLVGLVGFAGSPYFGGETGLGLNGRKDVKWSVGAFMGYSMTCDGVSLAPELMVGSLLMADANAYLGDNPTHTDIPAYITAASKGHDYSVSENFQAAFRLNLSFRLYRQLWFYVAPNVEYMVGKYYEYCRHWSFSCMGGFKYQWKKYVFRLSYNQKIVVNETDNVSPVILGVEYHF